MDKQCCGTCDYFMKYHNKTVRGLCSWYSQTPTPYWMPSPQSLDCGISKNGGTACPCWQKMSES